jgi:hypothetical protein
MNAKDMALVWGGRGKGWGLGVGGGGFNLMKVALGALFGVRIFGHEVERAHLRSGGIDNTKTALTLRNVFGSDLVGRVPR